MNDKYINLAILEAKKAYINNDVPVGAVIVKNGRIISSSFNQKYKTNCPLKHAEILAISDAVNIIGDWRLNDCEMYVTLEPCPMCAGAILQSRIKKIYIGAKSNIVSNTDIIRQILQNNEYYHSVEIEYLNNKKCAEMLTKFFSNKR